MYLPVKMKITLQLFLLHNINKSFTFATLYILWSCLQLCSVAVHLPSQCNSSKTKKKRKKIYIKHKEIEESKVSVWFPLDVLEATQVNFLDHTKMPLAQSFTSSGNFLATLCKKTLKILTCSDHTVYQFFCGR